MRNEVEVGLAYWRNGKESVIPAVRAVFQAALSEVEARYGTVSYGNIAAVKVQHGRDTTRKGTDAAHLKNAQYHGDG